jgi:hypothetical protein
MTNSGEGWFEYFAHLFRVYFALFTVKENIQMVQIDVVVMRNECPEFICTKEAILSKYVIGI